MKKQLFILTLIFGFIATGLSCAQAKTTQKEMFQSTYNEVKALVQSKDYKFAGEVVFNNKKRTRLDQALNTIAISKNEVSGQVSSLDNKTVAINGKITNYNVNFDDDSQKISIEFNVENMEVYIDIKPNGNAFLTIKSGVDDITQAGKVESR
ncbi:DUF4251 domain-containing protein [Winogradskyella sp.]|uniref:DUF4251 domain-containing protein n=1 Tax=Winogradskyella sp. TaxID=1883156 RepID=UPI0035189797